MESKNFRDYAIGIGCLMLVGGLVFTVVTVAWLLIKILPTIQSVVPAGPSFYGFCEPIKTGYVFTVSIDNYYGKNELKDVQCEMEFKGALNAEPEQQTLGDIVTGVKKDCYFLLKGDYEGPVSARVKFNNKLTSVGSVCRGDIESIEVKSE